MDTKGKQELLPPISAGPTSTSGWLEWLTNPLPGQFMLPATGLLIMGLDWLCFSEDAVTLGLAIPLTFVSGFLAGGIGTYHLQRKYGRDTRSAAWLKAVLAGFLVAIPFPLAGTFVGAWVLATSGLLSLKDRLWKARFSRG